MIDKCAMQSPQGLRAAINEAYRAGELSHVTSLIENALLSENLTAAVRNLATRLVEKVRYERKKTTGIDSFLP